MKKFDNYSSNLDILCHAGEEDLSNEFIISGIINKFSIQFELGWKVLKELLRYEGKRMDGIGSPRMILKAAFSVYDFIDEEVWLSMLKARNDMTHIYDGTEAKRLVNIILGEYIPAFLHMREKIIECYGDGLKDI